MDEYKVKEYPLEVECGDGGEHWSKGWQPQSAMVEAAECCCGVLYEEEAVEYDVWKYVPAYEQEFSGYYWSSRLGTPGAFPVTVVGR